MSEAVSLAIEIKLRRKDAAASNLFKEAYDKVVKGAEGICVKAVCDREELDLVSLSSEGSNIGFENSDLPVQAAEPPETAWSRDWHSSQMDASLSWDHCTLMHYCLSNSAGTMQAHAPDSA